MVDLWIQRIQRTVENWQIYAACRLLFYANTVTSQVTFSTGLVFVVSVQLSPVVYRTT